MSAKMARDIIPYQCVKFCDVSVLLGKKMLFLSSLA